MAVLKSPKKNHSKTYWRNSKSTILQKKQLSNSLTHFTMLESVSEKDELSLKTTWRSPNNLTSHYSTKSSLKLLYSKFF